MPLDGRHRRIVLGVADQALSSVTQFATSLIAIRLLDADHYGAVAAALAVATIALGAARALVGDTLLVYASAQPVDAQHRMVRDAGAIALLLGVLTAAGCLLLGLLPFRILADVAWMGVWLPAVLVQDAVRYRFFANGRTQGALLSDVGWVLGEAVGLSVLWAGGWLTGPTILAAWGAGALLGAIVGVALARLNPLAGKPLRWLRETWHLSGWFAAQTALGQAQTQGSVFIVGGVLDRASLGGLRAMQTLLVQPLQSAMLAAQSLLVPRFAVALAERDRGRIERMARDLTVLFTVGAAVAAIVVYVFRVPIISFVATPKYLPYANLMLPVALSSLCFAARTPYTSACRGLQNARGSFVIQAIYTAVTLPALIVGTLVFGLQGAAWGITVGSVALPVGSYWVYRRTLTRVFAESVPGAPATVTSPS